MEKILKIILASLIFIFAPNIVLASTNTAHLCSDPEFKKGIEFRESALKRMITDSSIDEIIICWASIPIKSQIWINRKITIKGSSEHTKIYALDKFDDSTAMIKFNAQSGGSVFDQVILDGRNRAAKGIESINVNGLTIKNSTFENFMGTNFKNGSITSFDRIFPARAISLKNSGDLIVSDNTIRNIGGYDTSEDTEFNGRSLIGAGNIAHRGIFVYGSLIGTVDIDHNTISNVFGYLDGDAIHIQNTSCNDSCYKSDVRRNTIDGFGKRAIKVQSGNVIVSNNTIYSRGNRDNVDNKTIGTSHAAISSFCLVYPCTGNIIKDNTISLERTSRAIEVRGPHKVSFNDVVINGPEYYGRGHFTYTFTAHVYKHANQKTEFTGNIISGDIKGIDPLNYSEYPGYCVSVVEGTNYNDLHWNCSGFSSGLVIIN